MLPVHVRGVSIIFAGEIAMKLALNQGLSGAASLSGDIERVLEAERLGYDSVWTSESYGTDAVTTATWIAARTQRMHVGTAIMQMAGRTPAATAMTAMTLDALSGGRFRLGLGVSGPQVVEGWHGQPFGKPLGKTREYVAIVRAILRREKPVEFSGQYYQIPYGGRDATGLGKPLRSILHGRADLPIYLAAIGPKNVTLTAEIADGWIPTIFSPRRMPLFRGWLDEGFRARGGAPATFDIMPSCPVIVGDDVKACLATTSRRSPSTWVAWARAAATSTTKWCAATATRRRRRRSRTCTWPAARTKRKPLCPTPWLTK